MFKPNKQLCKAGLRTLWVTFIFYFLKMMYSGVNILPDIKFF